MEVIVTSIISGFVFGGVIGHFTIIRLHNKNKKSDGPNEWMERHRNLNIALIQLRRTTEVKEDMVHSRQKNLQLQMNPHFIFNALTGIHMLLLREDLVNSLRAIRKFRGLLIKSWGNALENPNEVVDSTIREEINFLKDYVELEQMRLNTKVDFIIRKADTLSETYPLPTFLIQPLIENALWHGLDDSDGDIIELSFTPDYTTGMMTIVVADNGKGLSEEKSSNRKSFGLNILRERLLLISNQSSLSIKNRKEVRGCEARITIPLFQSELP